MTIITIIRFISTRSPQKNVLILRFFEWWSTGWLAGDEDDSRVSSSSPELCHTPFVYIRIYVEGRTDPARIEEFSANVSKERDWNAVLADIYVFCAACATPPLHLLVCAVNNDAHPSKSSPHDDDDTTTTERAVSGRAHTYATGPHSNPTKGPLDYIFCRLFSGASSRLHSTPEDQRL